jgi:ABC-type nitrate/sulfonate/bicarbonate transport system substrate-binding protein
MKTKNIQILFLSFVFFLICKIGISQTAQIPQFKTTEEKEAWIKAHPAEYQKMLDASGTNVSTSTTATTSATSTATTTDSTFPQYVNTGNKEKDDADYVAAKEAWIAAHPDKYKEMTGQPK